MAPLPHNNTGLIYVDYTTCGKQHVLPVRFSTGGTPASAMGAADAVLTAFGSALQLWTIDGARAQDVGTNVSYPITWTGAATYGTGAGGNEQTAYYNDFTGRSIDGRRVKATFFGVTSPVTNHNYRVAPGEVAGVDAAYAALIGFNDEFVTISGLAAVWNNYANAGTNAYWTKQIR